MEEDDDDNNNNSNNNNNNNTQQCYRQLEASGQKYGEKQEK